MKRLHWVGVAIFLVVSSATVHAQSVPPPDACQDQLRGVRVYAERLRSEKNASDLDAAQTIAALIKQVESLRAELEAFKKQLAAGSGQQAEPPKEKTDGR